MINFETFSISRFLTVMGPIFGILVATLIVTSAVAKAPNEPVAKEFAKLVSKLVSRNPVCDAGSVRGITCSYHVRITKRPRPGIVQSGCSIQCTSCKIYCEGKPPQTSDECDAEVCLGLDQP